MSTFSAAEKERWEELKAAQLLFGLSEAEQAEFTELSARAPVETIDQFEKEVAALDLLWSEESSEALPAHLRPAIIARGREELAARHESGEATLRPSNARPRTWRQYLPWFVSAACLAFAAVSWYVQRPTPYDPAQLRAELINTAPDLERADWSAGTTPIPGASGDVVWSPQRQQGFMRFRGLPPNTPSKEQYQLWIFDANQSDKTPIDGGVFDVNTKGEVIVPIDPKLRVTDATMFAVTAEKPGGVVVSSRERLLLLAKLD